jgi:hypothetical protein
VRICSFGLVENNLRTFSVDNGRFEKCPNLEKVSEEKFFEKTGNFRICREVIIEFQAFTVRSIMAVLVIIDYLSTCLLEKPVTLFWRIAYRSSHSQHLFGTTLFGRREFLHFMSGHRGPAKIWSYRKVLQQSRPE